MTNTARNANPSLRLLGDSARGERLAAFAYGFYVAERTRRIADIMVQGRRIAEKEAAEDE